jgi:hypothetical protein
MRLELRFVAIDGLVHGMLQLQSGCQAWRVSGTAASFGVTDVLFDGVVAAYDIGSDSEPGGWW